ncbi:MAG: hypothetical protein HDS64_08885 [Bacteroidales bacterium]|nr:hypothetical protein [Bacteroidales bacterium]MBD5360727.1 hypothetical protein [Bacteroides sp.]MBD5362706.1 hypothetical protein [Bacteroides sp.]
MNRSREIIEIFNDVVREIAQECQIIVTHYRTGETEEIACPDINYKFGNSRYIKENLDELSKTSAGCARKLPMIALFCPFQEQRDSSDYFSKATVNILIACSTSRDWSNEERLVYSFQNILRPIYRRLLEVMKEDGRFDFGYDEVIKHRYSENYSYGRYGAHDSTGDAVSEPIDAINITNLELKITNQTCR